MNCASIQNKQIKSIDAASQIEQQKWISICALRGCEGGALP